MLQNEKKNIAAIILAAGRSSRMGCPKALLTFENEISFAENTARQFYEFGISEIIFVINSDFEQAFTNAAQKFPFIKTVINPAPEKGRFFSFLCGLKNLPSDIEYCYLHNVDTPLNKPEVPNILWEIRNNADYIIPAYKQKGGHPVLLSKKVLTAAINEKDDHRMLKDFLNQFPKMYLSTHSSSVLCNINTPDEYKDYTRNK